MIAALATFADVHLLLLAHASSAPPHTWNELARAWVPDPVVSFALLASAWLYRRGSARLRDSVSPGLGLRGWERACFWSGWACLVIALVSPLHPWGQMLFSAHMTQHELLMLGAAPLLVLGRPLVAAAFALPRGDARLLSQSARDPALRASWKFLTRPAVAWIVHAVALWMWHVPALFEATLRSEFIHHLQHMSFFGSALLFWWALFERRRAAEKFGFGLLYLFTTMIHSGILGALITVSDRLIYRAYGDASLQWSLTPMEDQQLGGLIMWIPAGIVYVVAALALVASRLRDRQGRHAGNPLGRARLAGP